MPPEETTGFVWADSMNGDLESNWLETHNVVAAPDINNNTMKEHAWYANSWVVRKELNSIKLGKKDWKKASWKEPPIANYLIMSGLISTVGGVPVDLGFPGWVDFKACEKANLFDL